ncbi:MAG: tetrahydromethanopterin S-methyltransferase subunit H [Candidatus Atabeyarchaeum deiterrae]
MFKFSKEQSIFDISGVKVGGQPGQNPTVMIGSIFYFKQKLLKDDKTGEFDREAAETLLRNEEDLSRRTGNPRIVDVCASAPQAFPRLIDFVASTIEGPFTLDGINDQVRIAGLNYVKEVGLSNRAVYNSIAPRATQEEITALKEAGVKSSILLALNTKNPTVLGRIQALDELLPIARRAGIENILVDTANIDIPDPGPVSKAAYLVKEKYGLPAGAGTHNAVNMWRKRRKLEPEQHLMASTVANILPIIMGASFSLYGPIESAHEAYFYCGLADAYVAHAMRQEYKIDPLTREHPMYKIFRG